MLSNPPPPSAPIINPVRSIKLAYPVVAYIHHGLISSKERNYPQQDMKHVLPRNEIEEEIKRKISEITP